MPDLHPFAKNVSIADGPNVRDFGVMFTTRMAVVKLSDGSLWVNSPVAVQFDTLQRINQLGPVRYLVAATPRHLWRLSGPIRKHWLNRKLWIELRCHLHAANFLKHAHRPREYSLLLRIRLKSLFSPALARVILCLTGHEPATKVLPVNCFAGIDVLHRLLVES
jgi:hypothetical protein